MATTNTTNGITLLLSTLYTRVFYFGTTGQASNLSGNNSMRVNISKNAGAFAQSVNGGAAGPVEIANGWYSVQLVPNDVNVLGDLAYYVTGSSGGPATWNDQVVSQLFSQVPLDSNFRIIGASFCRQNQSLFLPFTMTSLTANAPLAGLLTASPQALTAQKNFGAGWSNCTGTLSDLGNGDYGIMLSPADTNTNGGAIYRFTASGANDNNQVLIFNP
jgi:hypothetical protein